MYSLGLTSSHFGVGEAALNITGVATSGEFTQSNTCPVSLAVNGVCTINVSFTPTNTGVQTGALSVTDNASASPQTVQLRGIGN